MGLNLTYLLLKDWKQMYHQVKFLFAVRAKGEVLRMEGRFGVGIHPNLTQKDGQKMDTGQNHASDLCHLFLLYVLMK